MNYLVSTFLFSFFGALFVLLRRVHENRVVGIPGDHRTDAYWPFNIIWEYIYSSLKKLLVVLGDFFVPHVQKIVGTVASQLYRFTALASNHFLRLPNMVHGKGTLKKNTGTTSLFIRDIAEYKKGVNRN